MPVKKMEEHVVLNGISLNIVDTAGIRSTDDIVEKIGVDKAKKIASEADLIIYVVDSSVDFDENDFDRAIDDFNKRVRRFGKTDEQLNN